MNSEYRLIVKESIDIELTVAEIYLIFYHEFPEDACFWWQIALEEKNHAALIRSLLDMSEQLDIPPGEMFSTSVSELRETNAMLSSIVDEYREKLPDRTGAFNTALGIEDSAGELHYQEFMAGDEDRHPQISKIFRRLNKEDKDHAVRIRNYMEKHEIPFLKSIRGMEIT